MKIQKISRYIAAQAARTSEPPSAYIGTDRKGMPEFDAEFLRVLTEEAVCRNWQLIELELFDGYPPHGIKLDGIFTRSIPDSQRVKELRQFSHRLIRIGSAPHPDDRLLPAVLPDLITQGRLAANHFAERGFSHLGFVGRKPWSIWENVFVGVQGGAGERGMDVELLSIPAFPQAEKSTATPAYALFSDWIRRVPKPLALVCPSDYTAAKFCAWARSDGLQVPTDVAILGSGNNPSICERCLPRLSSIGTAEDQRGIAACELMAELLAGKKPPREAVMIPPSGITVRESTDVLAAVDPTVSEALRFMWANLSKNLSVEEVARHTGLHRRKLERGFRHEFGRGVNAELHRRRLEKCCELLRKSELTVAEIASMTGFRSDDYLYRTFRRTFGATPIQWRNKHQ